MGFTIEDKTLIINRFLRDRQPVKRLCIASTYVYDQAKKDVSIKQKMR
jgi:hypothetical protein